MEFELIELVPLSGSKCTFYTIKLKTGATLLDNFITSYDDKYKQGIDEIFQKIKSISNLGAREYLFKDHYGKPGDGVCALADETKKKLRLMCIRFSNVVVILGDGGPKSTRSIQSDPELDFKRKQMIKISKLITKRMLEDKELYWSADGLKLEGNFKFEE